MASSSVSSGSGGATGNEIWSKVYGGSTDEEGNAVAVDAAGNVLVGGYFTSTMNVGCGAMTPGGGDTPFLFKVDSSGNCLWSKGFAISQVGTTDQVKGVAVDAAGNVYIVGTFFGAVDLGGGMLVSAGLDDIFIAKYTPAGAHLWSKRFGDVTPQRGKAIAVDAAGNVIIAGEFYSKLDFGGGPMTSAGGSDTFVAKFDTAGNFIWNKRAGDGGNQTAAAVAVDAMGQVVITGTLGGSADFGGGVLTSAGLGDVFVAKFSSAGAHIWSKSWGDAADQIGTAVATDAAGDVVLTGYFAGGTINFGGANLVNQGGNDAFLVKLSPAGNHLWSRAGGGPNNQSGLSVAVDAAGNVALAGLLSGAGVDFGCGVLPWGGQADIVVAKYDPNGACVWSHGYGDANVQFARAIAAAPNLDLVMTGLSTGPVDFGGGALGGFGGEDVFLVTFGP